MQTLKKLNKIVNDCDIWCINTGFKVFIQKKGDGFNLQIGAYIPNVCKIGPNTLQKGAKQYISSYAIDEEVVGALFKLFKDFMEHEAREGFRWKGQRIYGPHFQLKDLHKMAASAKIAKRIDKRKVKKY